MTPTPTTENILQARLQQYIRWTLPPGIGFAAGLFLLMSDRLRALVESVVETQPLGELALRGFQRPVAAHDVIRRI